MTYNLSKVVGFLIDPLNLLAALALLALLCLLLPGRRVRRFAVRMLTLQAVLLVVLSLLPVGQLLLYPLERRFPVPSSLPEDLAGIVVLGGAIDAQVSRSRGSLELVDSSERLLALAALARQNPQLPVVYTGRNGPLLDAKGPETAAARRLRTLNLPTDRVILEGKARNTWEEAIYTRALLGERMRGRWLLVTSAWHMPRAVGVFRKAGWDVLAYPVDYRTAKPLQLLPRLEGATALADVRNGFKEWAGLFSYWAMNRTAVLLPGPDDD